MVSSKKPTRRALQLAGLLCLAAPGLAFSMPDGDGWRVQCDTNRTAPDDPIVFPGKPGLSHLHVFLGARGVNARTTTKSLLAGGTTCTDRGDRSAYWTPQLYLNGKAQRLSQSTLIYYRTRNDPAKIKSFPVGIRVVAGNAHTTTTQSDQVIDWGCNTDSTLTGKTAPVECGGGSYLMSHVYFPDCWDGRRKDSPDHHSHMAYSIPGGPGGWNYCPRTHPVALPALRLKLTWPDVHTAQGVTLASGPNMTMHADFWNGWNPARMTELVKKCVAPQADCGVVGG